MVVKALVTSKPSMAAAAAHGFSNVPSLSSSGGVGPARS